MTDDDGGLYAVVLRKRMVEQYGKPYVWGGASPETGFDCSGIVYYVMKPEFQALVRFTADAFLNAAMKRAQIPFRVRNGGFRFMFNSPLGVDIGFTVWSIDDVSHMGLVVNYELLHSIEFRGEAGVKFSRDSILRDVTGYSTIDIQLSWMELLQLVYDLNHS